MVLQPQTVKSFPQHNLNSQLEVEGSPPCGLWFEYPSGLSPARGKNGKYIELIQEKISRIGLQVGLPLAVRDVVLFVLRVST
jgi:hypothetical protein